ncbi:armadillo repeat-containing protein 5 isoform X3 [Pieris napi]|uniref:armadillo repeat-containing protein 5 isoform X3 n=1 Tax=Pieris napi TaxID=78633 RepID=UPI001FB9D108|nr:armadillo repeat-containing protein 5 isoform X3 [Pieris napi]
MDKNYLQSIIDGLKSSSSSRIQDSLTKIRSSVITSEKGTRLFRECGGLECLIPHLRKPNERILDVTLSILGNICLDEKCSLAVGKLNTFGPLVCILNTVCRDSILGRACKMVGNLAQSKSNAENLHNHGIVKALVSLIESRDKSTSNPTLTMAVRAIRQLWMITDKRDEMLSLNVARCVAILLTTECESIGLIKSTNLDNVIMEPGRSQEELIIGILKCLGYFTTYSIPQCAEQLQGDGRGYQCLVALTKTNESLALKCLMNLCYLSVCRPLLGTAGLVECLVSILQRNSDLSRWPDGAVKTLAQLSGESVNRSRLRHCGGLPLLVAAARVNNRALHALLQYVFDDTAFQILIGEGLITLLTEKLTAYISSMEYEHNHITKEKSIEKQREVNQKYADNIKLNELCMDLQQNQLTETVDDLKVVIERDNMIVGFIDAIGSDKSDDSDNDSSVPASTSPLRRRGLKRGRTSPKNFKKKPKIIKMAKKDWSAGVYWEPKSPEPISPQFTRMNSPDRLDLSPLSPYSDGNWSGLSSDQAHGKRSAWDWSPASSSTDASTSPNRVEFPWSPSSSGPASPLSTEDNSSDSEVSGRYSPVCSDSEDERDDSIVITPGLDPEQVAYDLEELIMDDEESNNEAPNKEDDKKVTITKTSGIMCILVLMFRVSHGAGTGIESQDDMSPSLDLLTGRESMNALLDYVQRCRRPTGRAARIIARILSNSLCLISILKHRFVIRLHNMSVNSKHPPTECRQCKQLLKLGSKLLEQVTIVAESSHGIGEISYHLLKGTSDMKQTLSLTLPYIIRSEKILKKYFLDCEALDVLFSMLSETLTEDIQHCITALAKLATNLQIRDPKLLENRYKDNVPISYDPILDNLSQEDIVVFVLDDQSTVKANKNFLCQHSEVFKVMLTGSFKESSEKCVTLKKVSKQALEYLLTLLHCGLNKIKCDIKVFPLCENLETNLEVLLLADRFLFERIKTLLCSAIIQFQLTSDTADKIYIWSLQDGVGFLCVEALAYLLTGTMNEQNRHNCIKNILELDYKDQWLEDVKAMIIRQLLIK